MKTRSAGQFQQRSIALRAAELVHRHIVSRDVRVVAIVRFLLPVVCERLDGGQRGGLGATTTFEDQEKNDDATNETGNCNDDYEGLAEFDSSHPSIQKGWPVGV